jgi:membrane-associated phospholipid phosphatase
MLAKFTHPIIGLAHEIAHALSAITVGDLSAISGGLGVASLPLSEWNVVGIHSISVLSVAAPRFAFPTLDVPTATSAMRRLNLFILLNGTIHAGVFPSAHVSSAFATAWAMFVLEERRFVGWAFLSYTFTVAVATIYGRYHYPADVVAGFVVSLVAACIAYLYGKRSPLTKAN